MEERTQAELVYDLVPGRGQTVRTSGDRAAKMSADDYQMLEELGSKSIYGHAVMKIPIEIDR